MLGSIGVAAAGPISRKRRKMIDCGATSTAVCTVVHGYQFGRCFTRTGDPRHPAMEKVARVYWIIVAKRQDAAPLCLARAGGYGHSG